MADSKQPGYFRQRGKTWSFTVDLLPNPITGERNQATRSGFATETEAREACNLLIEQDKQGVVIGEITLGDFIKEFFESDVINKVEASTYDDQWRWAKNYIIPHLGKMNLKAIKHRDIIAFHKKLLKEGRSRGLIRNIDMVLTKTLKAAVIWDLIETSPAQYATPPTYKPKKPIVWNEQQTLQFITNTEGFPRHELYTLALTTGMRVGELLALKEDDFDFTTNKVSINKILRYLSTKGFYFKDTTKNEKDRIITVPQFAMDKVKRLIENEPVKPPVVFHNAGNYIYPTEASRMFQNDCKKAGLPIIKFHGMRHTHATQLLQKYSVAVVAERLGDTEATIYKTYGHALPNMQSEVAAALDNMFKPVDNSENNDEK